MSLLVRLGQVEKNPLSMACQNVLTGEYPAVACNKESCEVFFILLLVVDTVCIMLLYPGDKDHP